VLVAQVPKGGQGPSSRYEQAHFNRRVMTEFFLLEPGDDHAVQLARVDENGESVHIRTRRLVYAAESNMNPKLEFDFDGMAYPDVGRPILVIVEVDFRSFQYVSLFPGQPGHAEMNEMVTAGPKFGNGLPRIKTTLDQVLLKWPLCPIHRPST
jgi:hypothetical protein